MRTLAKIAFEYMWMLMFEGEDVIDLDYAVKAQENLSIYISSMSQEEREALSAVAEEAKRLMLAEPDQYGYTPRSKVTEPQKAFLEAIASGDFF